MLEEQAQTMLSLQADMNARVDPRWLEARYPYLRAVAMEGAEAIEHHGWKWWKKQDKDLHQLRMELIDIWHFILSEILLRNNADPAQSLAALNELLQDSHDGIDFDGRHYVIAERDLPGKLELLIALSIGGRIDLALFGAIMEDCGMDWDSLYRQYVAKNVLNLFRQDKGYKEGVYRKIWRGREDNEYLVEIMAELDSDRLDFKDRIYAALEAAYPAPSGQGPAY